MGAWVAAMALAVAAPALAAASALDGIEVVGEEATTVVRLHLSQAVAAEARTLPARDGVPARIYLDLPGTVLGPDIERRTAGSGSPLLAVRVGQFDPATARVVLDVARAVPFRVHATERTITIELAAPPEVRPQRTMPRPAAPEPRTPEPPLAAAPATPPRVVAASPPAPPRGRAPASRHPLIVLDPGHGGRDPGTAGVGGVLEKDVVLELAELLASRLTERLPVDVLLTRTDDSFVPIERRIVVPGEGAAVFLSLHANACSDPSARGLEVFYGGGTLRAASTRNADSRAALLGRCLDRALEARVGGVRGRARPGTFRVLVRNPVPSALIEIGYLTHPDEAARTRDTDYQALLADALVDAVAAFLRASAPPL